MNANAEHDRQDIFDENSIASKPIITPLRKIRKAQSELAETAKA